MDRMTYVKHPHSWNLGKYPTKYTSRHTFQEVVARLAAYEDTGLEPEEIKALAEGETIKRGKWVGEGDGYADGAIVYDVWHCSECDHCIDDGTDNPEMLPNYCPECGAKMRENDLPQQKPNTPLTLEDLREMDGEPVVFPCKVGDLLYEVDRPEYGVITCRVLYISYYTGPAGHVPGNPMVAVISIGVEVISGHGKGSSYCFEQEDIGKLVFLTRQEAEDVILSYRRKPGEGET